MAPRLEANKQDSLEAYVDSKIMCNLRCLCFQIPGKSPNTGLNGTVTNSLNQITPGTPPTGDSRAPAAQQKQVPSPTHFLAADSGQKKWYRWIQKKLVVFSNHPELWPVMIWIPTYSNYPLVAIKPIKPGRWGPQDSLHLRWVFVRQPSAHIQAWVVADGLKRPKKRAVLFEPLLVDYSSSL